MYIQGFRFIEACIDLIGTSESETRDCWICDAFLNIWVTLTIDVLSRFCNARTIDVNQQSLVCCCIRYFPLIVHVVGKVPKHFLNATPFTLDSCATILHKNKLYIDKKCRIHICDYLKIDRWISFYYFISYLLLKYVDLQSCFTHKINSNT